MMNYIMGSLFIKKINPPPHAPFKPPLPHTYPSPIHTSVHSHPHKSKLTPSPNPQVPGAGARIRRRVV